MRDNVNESKVRIQFCHFEEPDCIIWYLYATRWENLVNWRRIEDNECPEEEEDEKAYVNTGCAIVREKHHNRGVPLLPDKVIDEDDHVTEHDDQKVALNAGTCQIQGIVVLAHNLTFLAEKNRSIDHDEDGC